MTAKLHLYIYYYFVLGDKACAIFLCSPSSSRHIITSTE